MPAIDPDVLAAIKAEVTAQLTALPPPPTPDLSGFASKADVAALAEHVGQLAAEVSSHLDNPSDETASGGMLNTSALETKRIGIWLQRVLSKFHSAERPTDDEVDAASPAPDNGA